MNYISVLKEPLNNVYMIEGTIWHYHTALPAQPSLSPDSLFLNSPYILVFCEDGWTPFVHTGMCYKLNPWGATWKTARNFCRDKDGDLVSIKDQQTNEFIVSLGHPWGAYMIGGHDETEGEWKWSDGSHWVYSNWNTGEPNNKNGAEDYLVIQGSGGKWADVGENSKAWFYCQKA